MSQAVRNIVIGVADLQNDPVLPPVLELARKLEATLHIVHAYEIPDRILDACSRAGLLDPDAFPRYRSSMQAALEKEVQRLAGGQQVHSRAVPGSASRAICGAAEEVGADLVIVGATRQRPMMQHILGSTADKVIRSANAPVLVLRSPSELTVRRVLLTTDLSAVSAGVLERGIELADTLAAPVQPELRCVLVAWYDVALPPPLQRDALTRVAGTELTRFLRERGIGGERVEERVRIGDPPKEIVSESADWMADLVVVGTHGRSGVSHYLLGSVAGAVLRSALGNVLVIPAAAAHREHEPGPGREDVSAAAA